VAHAHDVEERVPSPDPSLEGDIDPSVLYELVEETHGSHFWRHFWEMLGVMVVGMVASGAILMAVVGLKSWNEVTIQYPNQALLVMAVGMSVPMVAWMRHRRMGWRNSSEMAAAMVVPVIPFLCLVLFHVGEGAQCGAYCATTVVAMLALMLYRRSEYSMPMMQM
jgi:hypothetical protein